METKINTENENQHDRQIYASIIFFAATAALNQPNWVGFVNL